MDPTRDIMAELTGKEYPNVGRILPSELSASIELRYRTLVRQQPPESGKGTSERERADITTRRIFRLWDIYTSKWDVVKPF